MDMVTHLYGFSDVSSNCYLLRKYLSIDCKDVVFHLYGFSDVSSNCYVPRKSFKTLIAWILFFKIKIKQWHVMINKLNLINLIKHLAVWGDKIL